MLEDMATVIKNNPKLFVFDCDSTIIENEVIELIAEEAGSLDLVADITERAMMGSLDFKQSLAARVATLKDLDTGVFARVLDKITVSQGVEELIAKIKAESGYVAIVSGGFYEVLDPLAQKLGADVWMANRLEVENEKLTGKTEGKVVDASVKAEMLEAWASKFGVALEDTVAVGDGANDIEMMKKAGLSVAYNAKPVVREVAQIAIENDLSELIKHVY